NTGCRVTKIVLVQISTTGKALRKFRKHAVIAAPVIAHTIAVFTVPFAPSMRELAYLVTTFANIPWLSYQFNLRYNRVLVNDIKKGTQPVNLMQFSRKCRSQVETETIHVHFGDPVA